MQSELCTWQNSVMGQKPLKKYTYTVPSHETATHRAKFGCLPVSDIAAVTKPRRKTPMKFAGVPQTNEQISAASGHHIVSTCGGDIAI